MNREKAAVLLAKLDALAANPGTPHEGEAARRRAAAIREKYAVAAPTPLTVPVRPPQLVFYWNGFTQTNSANSLWDGIRIEFR